MAMNRVTWFFQLGPYGWSEHLHNLYTDLSVVQAQAETITPFRLKMLPRPARITYIRISNDEVFRDSLLVSENAAGQGTPAAQPIAKSTATFATAILRLFAAQRKRRVMYIRPIADAMGDDGVRTITNAAWLGNFAVWSNFLTDATRGWAIKGLNPANLDVAVKAVSPGPAPRTITTFAAHGLASDDIVSLRGLKGNFTVNVITKVISIPTGTSFTATLNIPDIFIYFAGGFVRKRVTTLDQIVSVSPIRVGSRRTGRPFDSPSGRRKKAKILVP